MSDEDEAVIWEGLRILPQKVISPKPKPPPLDFPCKVAT